eukprot:FR737537.1.p1 GENE.FR737537.1~~FR737537.1.p1  ORF type:complete len:247 (+),score=2.11 FR737537.1:109-741(+)
MTASTDSDQQPTKKRRLVTNPLGRFATASASAVAGDFAAFPADTLKVRLQLHGGSTLATARILLNGGLTEIYRGVSASAFRQCTYGGLRLALYEPIRNLLAPYTGDGGASFLLVQLSAGAASGAVSSAIMCPADVVKVRMQANTVSYHNPRPTDKLEVTSWEKTVSDTPILAHAHEHFLPQVVFQWSKYSYYVVYYSFMRWCPSRGPREC